MKRRLNFEGGNTPPVKPQPSGGNLEDVQAAIRYFESGEDAREDYLHFDAHFGVLLEASKLHADVLAKKAKKRRKDFIKAKAPPSAMKELKRLVNGRPPTPEELGVGALSLNSKNTIIHFAARVASLVAGKQLATWERVILREYLDRDSDARTRIRRYFATRSITSDRINSVVRWKNSHPRVEITFLAAIALTDGACVDLRHICSLSDDFLRDNSMHTERRIIL